MGLNCYPDGAEDLTGVAIASGITETSRSSLTERVTQIYLVASVENSDK